MLLPHDVHSLQLVIQRLRVHLDDSPDLGLPLLVRTATCIDNRRQGDVLPRVERGFVAAPSTP